MISGVGLDELADQSPRAYVQSAAGDAPSGLETAEVVAHGERGAALLDPPHVDLRQVQVHLVQGFLQEDVAAYKDVDIGLDQGVRSNDLLQAVAGRKTVTCRPAVPSRPVLNPAGLILCRHGVDVCWVSRQQGAEVGVPGVGVRRHDEGGRCDAHASEGVSDIGPVVLPRTAVDVIEVVSRGVLIGRDSFGHVGEADVHNTRTSWRRTLRIWLAFVRHREPLRRLLIQLHPFRFG
mmetsp:Transcript_29616/g.33813  ORF Transcript_29616/g.33813 Transcript_29616/m.33813 type:complete len:235 (+) Transcript_29616:315-1019(+)